ncbi:MAG: cbb3-type cytochrome c oxidase subunit I [Tepidisphaerales bacterium]
MTPSIAPTEKSEIDSSARCSLSLLILSSLAWLILGGGLAVVHLVQLSTPAFLADCPWLTFGHVQAMQETALIYGWAANVGLAVALWLLSRLGATPLRGANYVVLGWFFWNVAVASGLVAIGAGEMTSFTFLQMPAFVQTLMLVAYGVMAVPGVIAWVGRKADSTYASQWYAMAALFLFPWFFSVAQVMLLRAPARGVIENVIATWFAQNVLSLWLAPLAMAALYYLVPKLKGRVLSNYDFAIYGFWALLLFGSWTGGRLLVGGPVPAWIPTMAFVAGGLMLFHFIIVFVNLRGAFRPAGSTVLKFAAFGFAAYLLSGVVNLAVSSRVVSVLTQFTYFEQAQGQLSLAAFSLIMFAALYFMAPRLTGAAWPSVGLIRGHYLASILGYAVLIVALGVAGWVQGTDLNDAKVPFEAIAPHIRPWLLTATAAQALLVVGNLFLSVNFLCLMKTKSSVSSPALFRPALALEASAS